MDEKKSTRIVVIGGALFATLSLSHKDMLSCLKGIEDEKAQAETVKETANTILKQIAMAVELLRKEGIDEKRLKEVFVEYDKELSADLKQRLEAMHAAKFN